MIWIACNSKHQGHWVAHVTEERGLAITPWLKWDCTFMDDQFVITHVPSGRKLCEWARPLAEVKPLFDRLLEFPVDWTLGNGSILSLYTEELLRTIQGVCRREAA